MGWGLHLCVCVAEDHTQEPPSPLATQAESGTRVPPAGWEALGRSAPLTRANGTRSSNKVYSKPVYSAHSPRAEQTQRGKGGRGPESARAHAPSHQPPSRAGSPADVSWAMCSAPAWRRAGEPASAGGRGRRRERRSAAEREEAVAAVVAAPPCPASLPHTWMYRSAVRSTLRFDVFLSSTLGMLRFRVSKHSFRWALLGKGSKRLVSQRRGGGGGRGRAVVEGRPLGSVGRARVG
jgi:hypothetical protein